MKVCILGTRHAPKHEVYRAIWNSTYEPDEVVCGTWLEEGAEPKGADQIAAEWARANKIPVKFYHPLWEKFGKAAGPIRNSGMADYADAFVVVWDGSSTGTTDMLKKIQRRKKPFYLRRF